MGKWLTPPTIPAEKICRVLEIPADRDIVMAVNGALYALTLRSNWQLFGAVTPDEIAVSMLDMWNTYLVSECGVTCEQIIECITTDLDVQQAFNEWLVNSITTNPAVIEALGQAWNQSTSGGRVPDSYAGKNATANNPTCDFDLAWGNIRNGLIERSFQRVIDVLEAIEAATDNQEALAYIMDGIPVIGAIFDVVPVTDWIQFIDNIRSWMQDQFLAADTLELRDAIACDLFCIWQQDCRLTIDQIRQYYWQKTVEIVPSWETAWQDMATLLQALAGQTEIIGNFIVYSLVGTQYGFQSFINDWFGIHIDCIFGDLQHGDASDDWEASCADCPTFYTHTFPDADNWDDWTMVPFSGSISTVVDDEIFGGTDSGGTEVFTSFEITGDGNVQRVRGRFRANPASSGAFEYRLYANGDLIKTFNYDSPGTYEWEWTGDLSGSVLWTILAGHHGTAPTNYLVTEEIEFFGQTPDPFAD